MAKGGGGGMKAISMGSMPSMAISGREVNDVLPMIIEYRRKYGVEPPPALVKQWTAQAAGAAYQQNLESAKAEREFRSSKGEQAIKIKELNWKKKVIDQQASDRDMANNVNTVKKIIKLAPQVKDKYDTWAAGQRTKDFMANLQAENPAITSLSGGTTAGNIQLGAGIATKAQPALQMGGEGAAVGEAAKYKLADVGNVSHYAFDGSGATASAAAAPVEAGASAPVTMSTEEAAGTFSMPSAAASEATGQAITGSMGAEAAVTGTETAGVTAGAGAAEGSLAGAGVVSTGGEAAGLAGGSLATTGASAGAAAAETGAAATAGEATAGAAGAGAAAAPLAAGAIGGGLGAYLGGQMFEGSRAGKVGGGVVGGAAAGAAAGSVVPGIGTVIGGVIGGVLGAVQGFFA